MNPFLQDFVALTELPKWLLAIIITWVLFWKGLALWKAARRNSPTWFVVLLVINTVGILEILYFFLFSEMKFNSKENKKQAKKKPIRKNLSKQKAFIDN